MNDENDLDIDDDDISLLTIYIWIYTFIGQHISKPCNGQIYNRPSHQKNFVLCERVYFMNESQQQNQHTISVLNSDYKFINYKRCSTCICILYSALQLNGDNEIGRKRTRNHNLLLVYFASIFLFLSKSLCVRVHTAQGFFCWLEIQ